MYTCMNERLCTKKDEYVEKSEISPCMHNTFQKSSRYRGVAERVTLVLFLILKINIEDCCEYSSQFLYQVAEVTIITLFKRDFKMLTGCNLEYKLGQSEIVPQNAGQMVPGGSGRIE